MGRRRYRFGEAGFPNFLTCTIVGWLPVFTRPETVQIVLDSWRFLQDQDRLVLLGYVILENHIHFIAAAEDLAKEVGDSRSYTAGGSSTTSANAACGPCSMAWSITKSGTRPIVPFNSGRKGASRK